MLAYPPSLNMIKKGKTELIPSINKCQHNVFKCGYVGVTCRSCHHVSGFKQDHREGEYSLPSILVS